jgi:hypothetical protein
VGEVVGEERVRAGVLARVEVVELGVGEEVAFVMGEALAFVGEEDLVGVEEDGVEGSGNSFGWCRVDTMVEGVFCGRLGVESLLQLGPGRQGGRELGIWRKAVRCGLSVTGYPKWVMNRWSSSGRDESSNSDTVSSSCQSTSLLGEKVE